MTTLAQISDLHITRPGTLLCDRIDTARYLAACVARLAALAPDAVLITGDLVEAGEVAEYERLHALLAPLAMPVHLMMGNHDRRDAFTQVFARPTYYSVDVGALRVIALDSHDPAHPRGGGRLGDAQRAWLADALASAHDRPVVIALHHPPFATGLSKMDAAGLADADALAEIVRAHANVERVICGHLHRNMVCRFAGTLASTAPSVAHQVALAFDGSLKVALEPPGIVLHRWDAGTLVSHHSYVDAADTFAFS